MKKTLFIFISLFFLHNIYSQNLGYGVLAGYNIYDIEVEGPLTAETGHSGLNIGGFVEYKLNSSFGIKGHLLFNKTKELNYYVTEGAVIGPKIIGRSELNTLQTHALVKFDTNKEYNKGFYLVSGIRMTYVLSAKEAGENINDFYRKANLGGMMGFGLNFSKYTAIEFIPEYNLTNTLKSKENRTKNFGLYINFTINIEPMINSKKA